MFYVFVEDSYTTEPELFVAANEKEMLMKLKARFRRIDSKAITLEELEKDLEKAGRGYHGAADYYFKKVVPK